MQDTKSNIENILRVRDGIKSSLLSINTGSIWYHDYIAWKEEPFHDFDSLLYVNNPLTPKNAGDREFFDKTDESQLVDLDVVCMSAFFAKRMKEYEREIVRIVSEDKVKTTKVQKIKEYFSFVEGILNDSNLYYCIASLDQFSKKQAVLYAKNSVDLPAYSFSLFETLRKSSIEGIYLQYTLWRITDDESVFSNLVSSIVRYIQDYYDEFDKDPEMGLYASLDGMSNLRRLLYIEHWLELIAYHTQGIFDKYKKLNWLHPTDSLGEGMIFANTISKYEMLHYRLLFQNDTPETVVQKAVCNHSYGVWIKTTDVMYIVCNIFRILCNASDDSGEISRGSLLQEQDNMLRIRDYYTGMLFLHRTYYQEKKHYVDSRIMEILESDAEIISSSINDVIDITSALTEDSIDGLLQAKHNYVSRFAEYMTEEQTQKLDEYMMKIVERIKEKIQKLSVYEELYSAVSSEFTKYSDVLLKYPSILSSLVSAEYLYKQYVDNQEANEKFDYSCISIMYYMALEDFVNKLVYSPYAAEVLSSVKQDDWRGFVSDKFAFWDKKNKSFKKTCELGNLGYLLAEIEKENELDRYLVQKFPKINKETVKDYGNKLKDVAPRRNEAAHGGNILSYTDVQTDKGNVFNEKVNEYKGLILELLGLIFAC